MEHGNVTGNLQISGSLRGLHHSETLLINERSSDMAKAGHVHRFGFGQSPFPVPDKLTAALGKHAHAKDYAPVQGRIDLRTAVADFHRSTDLVDWQPERTIIGPGSKLLIYSILAAFETAEVLLLSPSWVSYEPQALLAGHRVNRLQTRAEDFWTVNPDDLRRFCRHRRHPDRPLILILNTPGNPSGTHHDLAHLSDLVPVLREFGVLVISDEIYGMLHHRGEHHSLARVYPEGTLVTGGLSKWCGAGGWRLGIMQVPEALSSSLMPALLGVASETWSCVASPVQLAAREAYDFDNRMSGFVSRQRQVLSLFGQQAAATLNALDIHTQPPTGGFYLFPDFGAWRAVLAKQGITTSSQLCDRLLGEARVALLPGSAFGMPAEHLSTRLAYVNFDGTAALDEMADLTALFKPIGEGIAAIGNWLQALK